MIHVAIVEDEEKYREQLVISFPDIAEKGKLPYRADAIVMELMF